jgi:hypothetical protein
MMVEVLPVIVNTVLPIEPTAAENTVRAVRHGLADVLAWLGEDVGPKPGAATHAVQTPTAIFVSREGYDELKKVATLTPA